MPMSIMLNRRMPTDPDVRALDIRAGAGVVLAALVADGASIVRDVKHIDRGYDGFVANLRSLGAVIEEGRDTDAPTAS